MISNVNDPCNGATDYVIPVLGEAYNVVKQVQSNLAAIQAASENIQAIIDATPAAQQVTLILSIIQALAAGVLYDNTAAGLDPVDGVLSGEFFATWESGRLRIYLNDAGVAVQKLELLTSASSLSPVYEDLASSTEGKGGALIALKQSDPEALSETVQDAYRRTVSVRQWGVFGDGTNETEKIQKAVTFACNNDLTLVWPQPQSAYVLSGLTFPAGKNIVWRGEGRKRVKITGLTTDATVGAPSGSVVDVEGFRFQDFLSGFNMDGIAAGAELRFHDLYLKNCGRTRNLASARTDYRGFIMSGPDANKIESLEVSKVIADQGDFTICYRGKFKSASVHHVNSTNMERTPVWLGWNGSSYAAYDREFAEVKHCRLFNTVSSNAAEYEIHGIFISAACFDISFNYIDTVTDTHASIHDSEAIYVKGPIGRIQFNTVIDGGRGDGAITSKSMNYSGGPAEATDSRYGRYVEISGNVVQRRAAYTALYGQGNSAYFCKAGGLNVHHNHAYGSFDTFYACYGGGRVSNNEGEGQISYGVRFFPSYIEGGLGILATKQVTIEGNEFSIWGGIASAVNVRMSYTSGGQSLESLVIRGNVCRITGATTWGGENAFWSVRVDRVAAGTANEIKRCVIEDNKGYAISGSPALSCYRFDTSQGSAGVAGKITSVRIKGGQSDYTTNIVTHSWGSAGDCVRMEVLNEIHDNVSNEVFSGTPANVTNIRVRGIGGSYKSEARGTLTFNAADTSKTLVTGFRASMFPSTLALSNVSLTIAGPFGASKSIGLSAIDIANRAYTTTVDAAPGATLTINWEARNQYFYN